MEGGYILFPCKMLTILRLYMTWNLYQQMNDTYGFQGWYCAAGAAALKSARLSGSIAPMQSACSLQNTSLLYHA